MDNVCENLKTALQNNDLASAAKLAKEHLENLDNVPLTIAVTGESGSGKSTLVNALRGLKNSDEGAAPTGVVETTVEVTEYLHPHHPNIKICDLPGIGTTRFPPNRYLKNVGFEKFDFFIIVSESRFRDNDAKLAEEIQKMKKKFYFVRSKIYQNIASERQKGLEEENIRDNCTKELEQLGIESPKVFLVSSFDLHLYDFNALGETLEKELPEHKRHALLLSLPNISLDIINKKKQVLKDKIKWYALASAAGAAVPLPGTSIAVDLVIIMKFVNDCQKSLGLRAESLQSLSEATGVPMEELKKEVKSPLTGVTITNELLMGILRGSVSVIGLMSLGAVSSFFPIVGIPVTMSLSGLSTYLVLKYLLKTLGEDAQRVYTKATGST